MTDRNAGAEYSHNVVCLCGLSALHDRQRNLKSIFLSLAGPESLRSYPLRLEGLLCATTGMMLGTSISIRA